MVIVFFTVLLFWLACNTYNICISKKCNSSKFSHSIVVVFALINCFGSHANKFIGVGKFVQIHIPREFFSGYIFSNFSAYYTPLLINNAKKIAAKAL